MNDTTSTPSSPAHLPFPATDAERRERLASWAKALGHPSRVQIVEFLLARRSCMCGDITAQLGCAQSTVSQHLKILKQAGIIQGTIDGPRVCYCVDPQVLTALAEAMTGLGRLAVQTDPTTCD